jgi:hypothetical protein
LIAILEEGKIHHRLEISKDLKELLLVECQISIQESLSIASLVKKILSLISLILRKVDLISSKLKKISLAIGKRKLRPPNLKIFLVSSQGLLKIPKLGLRPSECILAISKRWLLQLKRQIEKESIGKIQLQGILTRDLMTQSLSAQTRVSTT